MSAEATTTKSNPTRDLAASIFKDLVVNATEVNAEGVKMSASAENMAKLSMKLAEVFALKPQDVHVITDAGLRRRPEGGERDPCGLSGGMLRR